MRFKNRPLDEKMRPNGRYLLKQRYFRSWPEKYYLKALNSVFFIPGVPFR